MRKTLTIDEDVLPVARTLAEHNNRSLDSEISELAHRGCKGIGNLEVDIDLPAFRVDPDAKLVTNEDVSEALSEWP